MARKLETVFRMRLKEQLKKVPCSWFESIAQKSIEGTPDIIGCVNGVFVALELKAGPSSKATVMQRLKLSRIAEAGGLGLIVHRGNLENTLALLIGLTEGNKNASEPRIGLIEGTNNVGTEPRTSKRSEPSVSATEVVIDGKD